MWNRNCDSNEEDIEMNMDRRRVEYISPNGSKKWEYLTIFTCKLLILCLGIAIGWNSPIVALLLLPNSPLHGMNLDIPILAFVVPIGQILASPINMLLIDKIGRKYTILLSVLPLVAAWSIILITRNTFMWYVARFLSGISLVWGFQVAQIYLGEISSIETRGVNGTMINIMCNIGILVSYVLVPYLSISTSTGIFLFLSICFVILFSFMPESPYYLTMRGRREEAEKMLQKLRDKTDVADELTSIYQYLENEEINNVNVKLWTSLKNLFTIRRNRRAFFINFLLVLNIYFCSYIPLREYGQMIFKDIGREISDYTINIAMGIILLSSSVVTIFFVDRIGRKVLIVISVIIVGSCNLMVGSFFYAKDYHNVDMTSYYLIPIIASISAIFFLNVGFCSILPIMMSEIFAIEVKLISSAILGIAASILMVINIKIYIFLAISLKYGHSIPFLGFSVFVAKYGYIILFNVGNQKKDFYSNSKRTSKLRLKSLSCLIFYIDCFILVCTIRLLKNFRNTYYLDK